MQRNGLIIAIAVGFLVAAGAALAQSAPPSGGAPGGMPVPGTSGEPNNDSYHSDEQRLYRENIYNKMHRKDEKAKATDQAKQEAAALVQSVQLPCAVADSAQIAEGPATAGGKTVDTKTYEVTCSNGLGYLLVSQAPEKPYGFTCFAADASSKVLQAEGKPPSPVCSLPANVDLKAMAGNVLTHLGTSCTVRDIRWIGQSTKASRDFTEVACADGSGYVLTVSVPGSMMLPSEMTCKDSAARGVKCKMSSNGEPTVTVQTFKDALAQHNVACDATDVRVIGKENVLQRHVVEFQCPQHPKGLVAFIPLEGNKAPFETLDCPSAAKRGVICKLTR